MSRKYANLLCILIGMIWGGGFIATDTILTQFSTFPFLLIRFLFAALICGAFCLIKKKTISRHALKKGILSGCFLYAAFAAQTLGLPLCGPGINAFLTSVNVVLVPFISWAILRHRPQTKAFISSFLCLAGIGLISLSDNAGSMGPGAWYSLLCAFLFACQIVSLHGIEDEDPMALNTVQLSVAAILAIPGAILDSSGFAPISSLTPAVWLSLFYSVFFATFLCYQMQTTAQKYTSPSAASVLMATESLWANVFSFLILHETLSIWAIVGGLFIFGAVVLTEIKLPSSLLPGNRKVPETR